MQPNPSRSHSFEVAVTAMGIVSPLGFGAAETLETLREGRDCIMPVTQFDVSKCRAKTAGQVEDRRLQMESLASLRSLRADCRLGRCKAARLHRASKMMVTAIEELTVMDPGFKPEAAVIGTTSGGMSFGESFFRSLLESRDRRKRPAWLANYPPQKPVLDALESAGFRIPSQIIANACASGSNAIGHAFSLVRSGKCNRVLCGGYDAISELVFVGFDSLQAATQEKCRPFDRDRTGLVLGEGAALLALESFDDAVRRGAPILGKATGYGISTDNYHLTQPHPSGIGPRLAMERALRSAGRAPSEVDYINAHGTATPFNDATEGRAIAELFGRTPVSSTKSMMGHALGAAGAIEAVFCLLALQHQFMPPNINHRTTDPQWDLNVVANEARDAELRCVMSNSFGFGGTNATIILEK